jgi:hypothetical protein
MISIMRRKARTLAALQLANEKLALNPPALPVESSITTTGTINYMWHAWISFWRHYWLAHIIGGSVSPGIRVQGVRPTLTVGEALAHMRVLANRPLNRRNGPVLALIGSHEEITWGDLKIIQDVASSLSINFSSLNSVLAAASLHGLSVEHLQIVRNAHVHPSKSSVARIQQISRFYIVPANCSRPSEIIYSTEMSSGKQAFVHWVDSLCNFILMI